MQTIPARLMRAQTEACKNRPAPTERDRQRRAYILEAGRAIFIAHGRLRVTIKDVAIATGLTQIAIRNQIADLDHLFAQILAKYLDEILTAVGAVPRDQPDTYARRRAAYFRVTRGMFNIPTPLHFLWMRERFTLPEDELEPLEQSRRMIGVMLAGNAWETALHLLDTHHLDTPEIEIMLAAQAQAQAQAQAAGQPEAPLQDNQPPPEPQPKPQSATPRSKFSATTEAQRAKTLRTQAPANLAAPPAAPPWLAAKPPPNPAAHPT